MKKCFYERVLPGMYRHVWAQFGWRWTRLKNLIDAHDDKSELEKDNKFGFHVLCDADTQDKDEAGAKYFAEAVIPPRRGRSRR